MDAAEGKLLVVKGGGCNRGGLSAASDLVAGRRVVSLSSLVRCRAPDDNLFDDEQRRQGTKAECSTPVSQRKVHFKFYRAAINGDRSSLVFQPRLQKAFDLHSNPKYENRSFLSLFFNLGLGVE
jgi:hypothetical protein